MSKTCTIVWIRRDLRLEDNPALSAAARIGPVVPVFIWAPEEEGQFQPGRVSRWWLKQSLIQLNSSLRNLGAPLIMRRSNDSLSVLLHLVEATGAEQVFFNHLYDPISLVRDHHVKQALIEKGIQVQSFNADLLYEPWEVQNEDGKPFITFDSYWEKCMHMPFEPDPPLLPPRRMTTISGKIFSCTPEELGLEDEAEKSSNDLLARAWAPGWSNADKALESFLSGPLADYSKNRDKLDGPTTSLLSPHLHFGEISVRKVFDAIRRMQILWAKDDSTPGEESIKYFLRSIGFREYSRYLSFNFPFTHERSLLSNLKSFPWRSDEGLFKTWRQGRTGYPLVDAGMRELWATGWLHNRVRVIVSSFCVKFLQLPWRWGMKYFWDTLLDADLESDVLGWQYISGSLPDGHELDRMDDPQTEGYKYDPCGEYVRRWLPELARLPTEWIHHPWDAPPSVLRAAAVELGGNYPRPIVEVTSAKERLNQAVLQMLEQEAALKAAGIHYEGVSLSDGLKARMISTQSLKPEPNSNREVSSASSRCHQTVPRFSKKVKVNHTLSAEGLEAIRSPEMMETSSQGGNKHPSLTKDRTSREASASLMDQRGVTRPGENSTAESSSSPQTSQGNKGNSPSIWVPTVVNQNASSSFGCVPSISAVKLESNVFLVNKRGLDDNVEEAIECGQGGKRKYRH